MLGVSSGYPQDESHPDLASLEPGFLSCHRPMTNLPDNKSPAVILAELRVLIAAIAREAGRHHVDDVVDLAGRADELAAELERQGKQ